MTRTRRWRLHEQEGTMSVEMLLLVPVLLLILMLAVAGGRVVSAEGKAQAAARDAARQASLARSAAEARNAANESVSRSAVDSSSCTASADLADFRRGGSVTVRVNCHIPLGDLTAPGLPGSITVHGEATAPVDTLRGVS